MPVGVEQTGKRLPQLRVMKTVEKCRTGEPPKYSRLIETLKIDSKVVASSAEFT